MSATAESIAALIESTNAMTQTFSEQTQEIGNEIERAIKAIPELEKTFYVDSTHGSDLGSGDESQPLKTIYEAVSRTPSNGSVSVFVKRNQNHIISGDRQQFTDASRKMIVILPYDDGPMPTISMSVTVGPSGSILQGFLVKDSTNIFVVGCVIDTGAMPTESTQPWPEYGGFVSRASAEGEVGVALISLSGCVVNLRDHQFSSHYSRVDYNFRTVTLNRVGKQQYLNAGGKTFYCTFRAVSVTEENVNVKDFIQGITEDNSLTNIPLNVV